MNFFRKIRLWEKHHRIELFGIIIGILSLSLIIDLGAIKLHAAKQTSAILDDYSIYVSNFTTSLTGVEGTISQVYVNEDRTKCVILLRFDDMTNIVADASKYQIFVKGFDVDTGKYARKNKSNPTGGYYVFGATGYSAIYLTDANGFGKQCIECIVRCNELLVTDPVVADEEAVERDSTYGKYDQWRIIINPCGASAKVCDFLDDFDIVSLYQDAVIDENEAEIRETLTGNVKDLQTYRKRIDSYRENLVALGVNVPSIPSDILKDEIVYEEETGVLIYKPGNVFANGVDFDWFHNTLHDTSFMNMVKEPDMTDMQFFNSLQDYSAESNSGYYNTNSEWYMTDGTLINTSSANSSIFTNMKAIADNISQYEKAVSDYYSTKRTYQCTNLVNYLALEANMKEVGKYFTSNYDEYTVIVW